MPETADMTAGVGGDPDRAPHEHVHQWGVVAGVTHGDFNASLAEATILDRTHNSDTLAIVSTFVSPIDGAVVVQIDTSSFREVPVRVTINDAPAPAFDQTIVP